ncbi:MAG: hypothetical protein ABI616_04965 [Pseudomonadota bacterium]
MTAHGRMPDPAAVQGTEAERIETFQQAFRSLERRFGIFTCLPIASLDSLALANRLHEIGKS